MGGPFLLGLHPCRFLFCFYVSDLCTAVSHQRPSGPEDVVTFPSALPSRKSLLFSPLGAGLLGEKVPPTRPPLTLPESGEISFLAFSRLASFVGGLLSHPVIKPAACGTVRNIVCCDSSFLRGPARFSFFFRRFFQGHCHRSAWPLKYDCPVLLHWSLFLRSRSFPPA